MARDGLEQNSSLWICDDGLRVGEDQVRRLPRVGVAYAKAAADWPLRYVTDSSV